MSTQVGTLLSGRYRLDAQIGAGGMSTVYRAFDTVLERQVAIKLMHREIASQPEQLERFRREARAVAQLNHPHVVGVIDAGEDDTLSIGATPFIVFEYVEGETLKDRIRRRGRPAGAAAAGPAGLPVPEAVAYAIEVARALGAAHERGIVHRDVKPQNVLLDEEGSAKVTDFGIARTLDQEGLTADGRVLGTTDYVSPEQALGHAVTGQSDLYSLGIVLFEMLTGDVPYKGDSQVAVAMKHVRDALPDVQARRPEVSASLAAVLDRATAKELDGRYPDARALIADLEDVLAVEAARAGQITGEATQVLRTLPARSRSRVPSWVLHPARGLLALAVLAVVTVAAVLLLGKDRTVRGTDNGRQVTPVVAGLTPVSLGQSRAHDYDPLGTGGEHPEQIKNVLDGQTGTSWSTERYTGGNLAKAGVGFYLDAKPGVAARELQLRSSTPGWVGRVYAARSGPPASFPDPGWRDVGTIASATRRTSVTLDTARQRFRYYLVWITKLPPGQESASVSEAVLFR